MSESESRADMGTQLEGAQEALSKLPILGPVTWLYARDELRRHLFFADIDWAVMPPIVLNQCRLYTKGKLPYAFVTWAFVSEAVDARLRSSLPRIAPHEWQSGPHVWLIDVVAPFGHADEVIEELRRTEFADQIVRAIQPKKQTTVEASFQEWPPMRAVH